MIHRQLKSPHIVELLHSFDDDQNIYIILEYCDGIELFKEIKQHIALRGSGTQKGAFSEETAAIYFKQIALGVKFMHDRNVLHRDLKLSNIMITEDKRCKIIDFGLAIQLTD